MRDSNEVSPGNDAAEQLRQPLSRQVLARVSPVLLAAGIRPEDVGCHLRPAGFDLEVQLDLPVPVDRSVSQALTVRVLDAVASSGQRFGDVEVRVDGPQPRPG